jgi:CheY-like chemotaxis protein
MPQSVLLLESDAQVVKDFTCSLRLVGITVHVSGDVSDAVGLIRTHRPALAVARPSVSGDPRAGLRLVEELSQKPEEHPPVIVLCTSNERTSIEQHLSVFDGELPLPIEFPSVTYRIQELIERGGAKPHEPEPQAVMDAQRAEEEVAQARMKAMQATPARSAAETPAETADRNMTIAYGIQVTVLQKLQQSPSFGSLGTDHVPKVVAAVTQAVCNSFGSTAAGSCPRGEVV